MKNNKGITLIALVITIIIILILTGISIQMLSGNNGILTRAKDAKVQMGDAKDTELIQMSIIESSLEKGAPNIEVLVPKLQEMGCTVSGESYPLSVSYNGKNYKIENNGIIQIDAVDAFTKEYKEVEYIESTGTQYIDTGYIPKTNTKLELTLSFSGEFSPRSENMMFFFSANQNNWFGMNFGENSSRI